MILDMHLQPPVIKGGLDMLIILSIMLLACILWGKLIVDELKKGDSQKNKGEKK